MAQTRNSHAQASGGRQSQNVCLLLRTTNARTPFGEPSTSGHAKTGGRKHLPDGTPRKPIPGKTESHSLKVTPFSLRATPSLKRTNPSRAEACIRTQTCRPTVHRRTPKGPNHANKRSANKLTQSRPQRAAQKEQHQKTSKRQRRKHSTEAPVPQLPFRRLSAVSPISNTSSHPLEANQQPTIPQDDQDAGNASELYPAFNSSSPFSSTSALL
jgi:hypothetical protein